MFWALTLQTTQYLRLSAAPQHCRRVAAAALREHAATAVREVQSEFTQFLGNGFGLMTQHWVTLWDTAGQSVLPRSTMPLPLEKSQQFCILPLCRGLASVFLVPRVSHTASWRERDLACALTGLCVGQIEKCTITNFFRTGRRFHHTEI